MTTVAHPPKVLLVAVLLTMGSSFQVKEGDDGSCYVDAGKGRRATFKWNPSRSQTSLLDRAKRSVDITYLSCNGTIGVDPELANNATLGWVPSVEAVDDRVDNGQDSSRSAMCKLAVEVMAKENMRIKKRAANTKIMKKLCGIVKCYTEMPEAEFRNYEREARQRHCDRCFECMGLFCQCLGSVLQAL
ncbi:hypothetical protein FOL46_001946 [Perkinsus olseni]|uniref:Uncharacterized protein n=1 Tax=Perkinsus olseni TaxID=32597 RepID=A0A7J6KR43_PEROL|nr:hypothetical protein FOL46_001946 [Perkinsus olseni]